MYSTLTKDEVRAIIFSHNQDFRQQFVQHFHSEIDIFITNLTAAYGRLQEMPGRVPYNKRSAWVDQFLFAAFNSLLTSFHLLISGLSIPAGNLMRHYGEALAMALLLSHWQIDTFDVFDRDPSLFRVDAALERVGRKRTRKLLGVDANGWEEFSKIISFYSKYSHASALAGASMHIFSVPGARQIGGEFDSEKLEEYEKEIRLSISACRLLYDVIVLAEHHLVNPKNVTA
jgi:hypothetical protein